MKERLPMILISMGLMLGVAGRARGGPTLDSLEKEITAVVAAAVPAVVSVRTEPLAGKDIGFGGEEEGPDWFRKFLKSNFLARKKSSSGSGFLIDSAGHILTTEHVINGAREVDVVLSDGRVLPARVVGKDVKFNLALLKLEGDSFPYLKLGRSETVKVGSWVIALGNPFGLFTSPSWGIVSGLGRSGLGTALYEDLIQITAPVNPGDSGGPLLNSQGEVVGIITATLSGYREFEFDWPFIRRFHRFFPGAESGHLGEFFQPSQAQGIGFAIPIDLAREVAQRLRQSPESAHGCLGIGIEALSRPEALRRRIRGGALIVDVLPGSPADKAGLQEGDIILSLDGKEITSPQSLKKEVLLSPVGKKVRLQVMRGEERMSVPVIVEEQSVRPPADAGSERGEVGITLQELSPDLAAYFGVEEKSGLLVAAVTPGSQAEAAGLKKGDIISEINRIPVSTLREWEKIIRGWEKGKDMLLKTGDEYVVVKGE